MHGKMRRMLRWAACSVGEAFRSIVFFHDMENARRVSAKNGYGAIRIWAKISKKLKTCGFTVLAGDMQVSARPACGQERDALHRTAASAGRKD